MTGGRDLAASERGMWCIAVLVIATALVLLRFISGAEWVAFVQVITLSLLAVKTVSGYAESRNAAQPAT